MVVADDRLRGRVSSSRRGIKSVVTRERVTLEGKEKEREKKKNNDKKNEEEITYIYISRFSRISLSIIYLSRPMITRWIVVT